MYDTFEFGVWSTSQKHEIMCCEVASLSWVEIPVISNKACLMMIAYESITKVKLILSMRKQLHLPVCWFYLFTS